MESSFNPSRREQSEQAKPGRADNKRVRLEFGEKDAFARFYLESLLSYIHVELSIEKIEEFVLSGVHVRRWFVSGC